MLSEGGLDMVTVAQTPVMFNSFKRNDFAIVAAMVSSYNDVHVLGRRDRGITKPVDLRGKRIGVTVGSTGQYFAGLFLSNAGIELKDVNLVNIKTGELVKGIQDGTVDAITTWQPHVYNAQKALGENSIVFPPRKIFREDFYFVPNLQFLQNHPAIITRFLQAISQAEDFIKDHDNEKEAIAIVANRLGLEQEFVASVWEDFQFGLFLDQTIIQTIEHEAQWAIQNKLTDKTNAPNYGKYISVTALKQVAPEKVLIIK
jgi:NitT/TauT family transport system substrate-binding protein